MVRKKKAPVAEPPAPPKRKGFPVHNNSCKKCFPEGLCIFCHKGFDVIEPVGYVKQKGTTGKKYYHARCVDPTIGERKQTPRYTPPPMPLIRPHRIPDYDDRTDSGLLTED